MALFTVKAAKLGRKRLKSTDKADYDAFYESFFVGKDQELTYRDLRMEVRRQVINKYMTENVPAGSSVLDAGCGLGEVLDGLPGCYTLHGLDYGAPNVEFTQRRLKDRAQVVQGSICDMPFPDHSMDACISLEVLEHVPDDRQGLKELHRVLKPGGLLMMSVPYAYYWPAYKELMGHLRHYTRAVVEEMLGDAGFEVVEHLPNHPNWHQSFTRHYAFIRGEALTAGRLLGCRSVFEFKWPWQSEPALALATKRLEPLLEKDRKLPYAALDTSTFVLARTKRL